MEQPNVYLVGDELDEPMNVVALLVTVGQALGRTAVIRDMASATDTAAELLAALGLTR